MNEEAHDRTSSREVQALLAQLQRRPLEAALAGWPVVGQPTPGRKLRTDGHHHHWEVLLVEAGA